MKKIIFISSLIIIISSSCQKLKDAGGTSAKQVANEWWATLDSVGHPDYYKIGHIKISTYNTAANDNTIWVDDFRNGYGFKIKATADYNQLTFSSSATEHNNYFVAGSTSAPETAHITDGRIFLKAAHSKTGNVVDSIHFKIEFSDDPGFIYEMNGVSRSRFIEDDY